MTYSEIQKKIKEKILETEDQDTVNNLKSSLWLANLSEWGHRTDECLSDYRLRYAFTSLRLHSMPSMVFHERVNNITYENQQCIYNSGEVADFVHYLLFCSQV